MLALVSFRVTIFRLACVLVGICFLSLSDGISDYLSILDTTKQEKRLFPGALSIFELIIISILINSLSFLGRQSVTRYFQHRLRFLFQGAITPSMRRLAFICCFQRDICCFGCSTRFRGILARFKAMPHFVVIFSFCRRPADHVARVWSFCCHCAPFPPSGTYSVEF